MTNEQFPTLELTVENQFLLKRVESELNRCEDLETLRKMTLHYLKESLIFKNNTNLLLKKNHESIFNQ